MKSSWRFVDILKILPKAVGELFDIHMFRQSFISKRIRIILKSLCYVSNDECV